MCVSAPPTPRAVPLVVWRPRWRARAFRAQPRERRCYRVARPLRRVSAPPEPCWRTDCLRANARCARTVGASPRDKRNTPRRRERGSERQERRLARRRRRSHRCCSNVAPPILRADGHRYSGRTQRRGSRPLRSRPSFELGPLPATRYGPSLIPIGDVYFIAHYALYLVYVGQLVPTAALDPLGRGWIPDTGPGRACGGSRLARSGGVIVWGHVVAVFAAHRIALRTERTSPPQCRHT